MSLSKVTLENAFPFSKEIMLVLSWRSCFSSFLQFL